MKTISAIVLFLTIFIFPVFKINTISAQHRKENLDRALIALPVSNNQAYIGWRILSTDKKEDGFDLYHQEGKSKPEKANKSLIVNTSDYVCDNIDFSKDNTWYLKDARGKNLASYHIAANKPQNPYLSIPIRKPEGGITFDNEKYDYTANDITVGDLDGDGEYEIILKWEPTNSKRPPQAGFTGDTYIDAYKLNGKHLWRINLGKNIRSGAAYTQLLVYDFDGDGKAELICKTGDGTIDGTGKAVGDPLADWRNKDPNSRMYGKIVEGPEYISAFEGTTGKELATAEYIPTRYPLDGWGGVGGNGGNDATGGRSDRFTACVAFFEKDTPSAVMVRGWYGRSVLAAWDYKDGKLSSRWVFDSALPEWEGYSGMGNHSVTVADFDGDGLDEVCIGAMTVDHNGKGLYTTRLRHGDALHAGDLIPSRPGLEVFGVHETEEKTKALNTPGMALFDGKTGEIIWQKFPGRDIGRGMSADIDPRYAGSECWSGFGGTYRSDTGEEIYKDKPNSCNFGIWWDADPLRELLDHTTITKWDWINHKTDTLLSPGTVVSNNSTKGNACLSADILGDWREEVIWRTVDNSELRIYSTTIPAAYKLPTLMHDHQYRMAIAWQNVAYNQPPHPSFDMVTKAKEWATDKAGLTKSLFKTYWTIEAQENNISFSNDTIEIEAKKGFTLWRNEKYEGNLEISFSACIMQQGKAGDRLSDLNCFWMAQDPLYPDDIFKQASWRDGVFGRYYSLNMYYLGYGGNSNTTTRFRKYNGNFEKFEKEKTRPDIITEYTDKGNLLRPNHWYNITIKCKDGNIQYTIDGKTIVDYTDQNPYTSGWFGFRTTQSRAKFTGFNVRRL
ncbi:rhamnogalacturonan lyase family protein [Dysgonomonas macrotermitis]|uniref:Rhamnogalacturonan endolyase n=1 Tax=Dysgonomonas macrotermitis TaxID=1346286 RepID=A0A1M5GR73_9BACT|nr:DUF6250 domain-containing protein [Dysgonomonas macrotermitis]SHG06173.1 rhamnogalacturonan endolyase [Dysgonomonas macrotermitis]